MDYDSDWFVHLISKDKQLESGIISRTSEIVPDEIIDSPQGFYVTFVVENAVEVFEIAKKEGFEIISEPYSPLTFQMIIFRATDDSILYFTIPMA